MNKEKICQNCKHHYIEEITFDYPQSCCAKEKTHHTTEKWCTCDKFEGNKEYFNNLEKYITKLELERDKQKEVIDKIKEYVENLLKEEFEITDPDNINYGEKCQRAYFSDSELEKILELLEEIE